MSGDDRIIYLVFTAQQKLRSHLRNALLRAGIRVTPAQAGILFLLNGNDGQSMTALSHVLSIDNSTMTGLIDRLQRSGFVKRSASPQDRRISRIHITPQGLEEVGRAKAVIRDVNNEIKAGFSDEQIQTFKNILHSFFAKFNGS